MHSFEVGRAITAHIAADEVRPFYGDDETEVCSAAVDVFLVIAGMQPVWAPVSKRIGKLLFAKQAKFQIFRRIDI